MARKGGRVLMPNWLGGQWHNKGQQPQSDPAAVSEAVGQEEAPWPYQPFAWRNVRVCSGMRRHGIIGSRLV